MGSAYTKPAEIRSKFFDDYTASLPRMEGKTVAITGCTTGTGFVLAGLCAQLGAKVIMLNRPSERANQALAEVKAKAANAENVTLVPCDLMDFSSVRAAGKELANRANKGLDVLVNNAGIMAMRDLATKDGCDQQMQTNHLSHFLLTAEVWPLLENAAAARGEARVVNHSSGARHYPKKKLDAAYLGKNGGNLGGDEGGFLPFSGARWTRYQQTKLANLVFTYALRDRAAANGSKVKALCAHPGLAATNLQVTTAGEGGMGQLFTNQLMNKMSQSCEDGSLGIIMATCAPKVESGDFYGPLKMTGMPVTLPSGPEEKFADHESRDMLWKVSTEVSGAKFPFSS